MAVSGSFSNSIRDGHYTVRVDWTAVQSVTNNTSTITAKIYLVNDWRLDIGSRSDNSITIAGTKYTFKSSDITTTGTHLLSTVTSNPITHNSDGTKTITMSCNFSMNATLSGTYYGTMTASTSVTLDTIARASSISVSNGTLGTKQTIGISRSDSSFKHKITYTCGTTTGYVVGSSSTFTESTSISWTPPLSLAKQNTTGTTVSISLVLTTWTSSGTKIGTTSKTITCAIPDSVKPSCSIAVSDSTDCFTTYGSYLSGLSKFKIVVTPTLAYESPISSYKTTVNSISYTASSFTTGVITTSGNVKITTTVRDKRGRSGTTTITVAVAEYTEPTVSRLTVKRCDEDGTENDQGTCVQVTMSAEVTYLNGSNPAEYLLKYKKTTETNYVEVGLDDYANDYGNIVKGTYIFEADTGSSYDVELDVTDNFTTTKRATVVSTAFTLMHFGADGTSISIGKVSEEADMFDVGLTTRFNQPVYGNVFGLNKLPEIPSGADLNDYMATGSYAIYTSRNAENIANVPIAQAGRLEVNSSTGGGIQESGWSYIRQRFIPYDLVYPVYERDVQRNSSNVWMYGDWIRTTLTADASNYVYGSSTILWGKDRTSGLYMSDTQSITLSEAVSAQKHGIVLVFCAYNSVDDTNYGWQSFFVPKLLIARHTTGHAFNLSRANFTSIGIKYLYIGDAKITGHAENTSTGSNNGITYANNKFVLRYVIGV